MSPIKRGSFATPARALRTALVTEELSTIAGAGGIGAAFHELALALTRHGHEVDLLFVPTQADKATRIELERLYGALGIRLVEIALDAHVWPPFTAERKSYAIFNHLRGLENGYDFVHFHDYKGLGFYSQAAKRQSLGFQDTVFVVQLHGPTRWTLEANYHPFSHEDQLKIDQMERESIAAADIVVSPSQYMLDWIRARGWVLPPSNRVHVIQNVCTELQARAARFSAGAGRSTVEGFQEIVFFGRHEERKGLSIFCDAIERLGEKIADRGIVVTFLGRFGEINGNASALYLASRTRGWSCPIKLLPDFGRDEATRYLAGRPRALVVIASPAENSPYTVLETVMLGKPLITSSNGGAAELLDAKSVAAMTCQMDGPGLTAKLEAALLHGLPVPAPRVEAAQTEKMWAALHVRPRTRPQAAKPIAAPRVTVGIVHHERPEKLVEAVLSIANQTYKNIELLIVDDGSRRPPTLAALEQIAPLLEKLGARLIRQPNLYLGAARNRIAREAKGEYVLFLDDDDIAFPTLVQTLVIAAEETGAAVVNCLNLFMEEARRPDAFPFPDRFEQKPSYLPLGGPLSLAALENCFGAATALLRRTALEEVGFYTELHGVGHEDYELYVRMAQHGHRIEICPLPLYLYEVGRPSMISMTSREKNFYRVARAIEPQRLPPDACADVMSLLAGKRAAEHGFNFRQYSIDIDPQADLLRAINGTLPASIAYCELVARYATVLGGGPFAASMLALAAARGAAQSGRTALPTPLIPPQPPAPAEILRAGDPLLLGAVIDLECGRVAPALAACALVLDRDGELRRDMVRVLQRLVRANCRDNADAATFVGRIGATHIAGPVFNVAAAPLFALALQTRQIAVAEAIVARALADDEANYLAANPDVAQAVGDGLVPSGLGHMATHAEEGRGGYALTLALCDTLRRETGSITAPELLGQHLAQMVPQAGRALEKAA